MLRMMKREEGIKKIKEELKKTRKSVPHGEKELEIAFVEQTEKQQ